MDLRFLYWFIPLITALMFLGNKFGGFYYIGAFATSLIIGAWCALRGDDGPVNI